jgi:hypothetical protein
MDYTQQDRGQRHGGTGLGSVRAYPAIWSGFCTVPRSSQGLVSVFAAFDRSVVRLRFN